MNQYGSSVTGSAVRPTSPKGIVRISSKNDVLQHYGVPGQKWGVITKEYEPVSVDRRKNRPKRSLFSIKKTAPMSYYRAEAKAIRERNAKRRKIAISIGLSAAALLAAYGVYRYSRITKAKAYSGLLNNFMKKNPSANLSTERGRFLMQNGAAKAKFNSKTLANAKITNRYLKRTGKNIGRKEALQLYKARRSIERLSNVPVNSSGSRLVEAVKKYDRRRLAKLLLSKYKI